MRFQIPQFIEVEDKIFGPLSIKQFIYLAGGFGLSVMFYIFVPYFLVALVFIIPIIAVSLALAFYKVNNKPFIVLVENAFTYILNPKLYIWRREEQEVIPDKIDPHDFSASVIPKLSTSKLKEMNWALDIKNSSNPGTEETKTG